MSQDKLHLSAISSAASQMYAIAPSGCNTMPAHMKPTWRSDPCPCAGDVPVGGLGPRVALLQRALHGLALPPKQLVHRVAGCHSGPAHKRGEMTRS